MRDPIVIVGSIASDAALQSLAPPAPSGPVHTLRDPDADVIRLVQQGNIKGALEQLMKRHGNTVYRYCRIALQDCAMADDVHQQVFIQAYRDLTEYRSLVSLRAWLLGIARHRVLDAAKSRRRISARISPHDLYQDAALMPSEPLAVATICMKRALEASLAKLPDSTRTLLLLRYQQGLSYQELGAVMRERPSTLQVRVNRALRKLRTDLERRAAASHEADLNLAGKRNKMRIGGDERA